jgi:hypothetical protein
MCGRYDILIARDAYRALFKAVDCHSRTFLLAITSLRLIKSRLCELIHAMISAR